MADDEEIITLTREDRIKTDSEDSQEKPKIAFKHIIIDPLPPELAILPNLMEQLAEHEQRQQQRQATHEQHQRMNHSSSTNHSTSQQQRMNQQSTTNESTHHPTTHKQDYETMRSLMTKYYVLLACLIVLITASTIICMKLKNIRIQAQPFINNVNV